MKLTLRTLIAFLDGTMGDDDAAAMRRKIRESEAIRELIQRIRRVVSQPQLPAPKTGTKGIGSDPNYSSEYIDSTLDVERVAEFEKMTIGSDILLAEIAEAHQVLASLSEVDEGVSGRLRNRLYKTAESIYKSESDEPEMFPVIEDHASIHEEYDDIEAPPKSQKQDFNLAPPKPPIPTPDYQSEQQVEAPPIQPTGSQARPQPTELESGKTANNLDSERFPDNGQAAITESKVASDLDHGGEFPSPDSPASTQVDLLKPDQSKHPQASPPVDKPAPRLLPVIFATACVTALIVLAIMTVFNRPNNQTAANDSDPDSTTQNESMQNETPSDDSATDEPQDPEAGDVTPGTDGESTSSTGQSGEDKKQNAAPSLDDNPGKSEANVKGESGTVNPAKPQSGANAVKKADAGDGENEEVLNLFKDKDYGDGKGPGSGKMSSKTKTPDKAGKSETPTKEVASPAKPPARLTDTKELMANAVKMVNGEPVGIMKSALQPTLRRTNLPEAKWINLSQEQPVYENDTIVALPDCRSSIEILESVRAKLFGFCKIELRKNEGEVLPLVAVHGGVVSFENLKDPNNTIDVSLDGRKLQVTFVDKTSQFAVAMALPSQRGGLSKVMQMAAMGGRIICKFEGEVLSLDQNNVLEITDSSHEIKPFENIPSAISIKHNTLTTSAKESFFALSLDNPVFDVAVEKALTDSKPYLRKFAAISAYALGDIEKLVQFLDDEINKSFWREAVIFARERAISDSKFRNQVLKNYCDSLTVATAKNPGENWFQFLTVTHDTPLENGLDIQLVDALESETLWIRVSAIQTLYALTGKTKFFRPEDKEDKRRKWVKAWEIAQEKGQIRVTNPVQLQKFE